MVLFHKAWGMATIHGLKSHFSSLDPFRNFCDVAIEAIRGSRVPRMRECKDLVKSHLVTVHEHRELNPMDTEFFRAIDKLHQLTTQANPATEEMVEPIPYQAMVDIDEQLRAQRFPQALDVVAKLALHRQQREMVVYIAHYRIMHPEEVYVLDTDQGKLVDRTRRYFASAVSEHDVREKRYDGPSSGRKYCNVKTIERLEHVLLWLHVLREDFDEAIATVSVRAQTSESAVYDMEKYLYPLIIAHQNVQLMERIEQRLLPKLNYWKVEQGASSTYNEKDYRDWKVHPPTEDRRFAAVFEERHLFPLLRTKALIGMESRDVDLRVCIDIIRELPTLHDADKEAALREEFQTRVMQRLETHKAKLLFPSFFKKRR